jgi:hypothetical protein
MKLNPEDLDIVSFDTSAEAVSDTDTSRQIIVTTNDPTAATRCFICPAETYNYCAY